MKVVGGEDVYDTVGLAAWDASDDESNTMELLRIHIDKGRKYGT